MPGDVLLQVGESPLDQLGVEMTPGAPAYFLRRSLERNRSVVRPLVDHRVDGIDDGLQFASNLDRDTAGRRQPLETPRVLLDGLSFHALVREGLLDRRAPGHCGGERVRGLGPIRLVLGDDDVALVERRGETLPIRNGPLELGSHAVQQLLSVFLFEEERELVFLGESLLKPCPLNLVRGHRALMIEGTSIE